MPKSGLSVRRIAITVWPDGHMFAGNVEVTVDRPGKGSFHEGSWPLSKVTAVGLGARRGAVRLHRCGACPGFFIGHYSARFCSDACAAVNHRNWVAAHRRPRTPSSAAQRQEALAAATCRVCGQPFKALRLSARFCSGRCRQKHHRLLLKASIVA
jgi:predicted nucleic acid-binding Zn ribbon protein